MSKVYLFSSNLHIFCVFDILYQIVLLLGCSPPEVAEPLKASPAEPAWQISGFFFHFGPRFICSTVDGLPGFGGVSATKAVMNLACLGIFLEKELKHYQEVVLPQFENACKQLSLPEKVSVIANDIFETIQYSLGSYLNALPGVLTTVTEIAENNPVASTIQSIAKSIFGNHFF